MDVSNAELNSPKRQKTDIRVVARFEGREASIFYIKVLPDLSVVIGTELSGFQVRRITSDGIPIEGDEALVDQPHVTFHPPGYFHLRADRERPLFQSLVWTVPPPGKTTSPWFIFVAPSLSPTLLASPPASRSKRKTIWPIALPRLDGCLCLVADFVPPALATAIPRDPTARFISAGEIMVRMRVGLTANRPAMIQFTVEG